MSDFTDASAVRRRDELTYDVDLHPGWAIGGKPNGGYLLSILARAAGAAVETDHPLAVSGHFLRAPDPGPAEVQVEVVRRGRRVSVTRATLRQADRACIDTLVSGGSLDGHEVEWSDAPPPVLPPPEECTAGQPPNFRVELLDHVELRLDPATAPFPEPSGQPVLRGWLRPADGSEPDVLFSLVAADALPPTVFNVGRYGWAPTVELTALLRGVPAPGWMLVEARTRQMAGGWFDEEATVWDATGRVVAQSRQLALAAG